jgi:hypothetical protein
MVSLNSPLPGDPSSCSACGRRMAPDHRFCPSCGAARTASVADRGTGFEWKSNLTVYGWPLVHVAFGRDSNGRFRVAKGLIAIGQFGIGLITVAQVGFGLVFGFGQLMVGCTALAQIAVTAVFGIGQIATGYAAVGQVVVGYYGVAQAGLAAHLWSVQSKDPEAARFFIEWAGKAGLHIGRWFGLP